MAKGRSPTQMHLDIDVSFVKAYRAFVMDGTLAEIGPNAFATLLVIKMASGPTGLAKIALRTIAERVGITKPTVSAAIQKLEEHKLLTVTREVGRRKCNIYQVSDKLGAYDPSTGRVPEGKIGDVMIPHNPNLQPMQAGHLEQLKATGKLPKGSPVQFIQIRTLNIHTGSGNIVGLDLNEEGITAPVTEIGKRIQEAVLNIPEVKKRLEEST